MGFCKSTLLKTHCAIVFILFFNISSTQAQGKVDIEFQNEVLFKGIQNPVKITVAGKQLMPDEYSVELSGLIRPSRSGYVKTDSCLWVIPGRTGKEEILIIGKNGKLIARRSYNVLHLPDPSVSLDHMRGGLVAQGVLCTVLGLIGQIDNFPFPVPRYNISSYRLILTNGNETRNLLCKGPLIPDTVRYFLPHLKYPFRLEFREIRCDSPYYMNLNSNSLFFESDGYEDFYRSYRNEIGHYGDSLIAISGQLSADSTFYDQSLPKIVETNCSSADDTCTTSVYYLTDDHKYLAFTYQFLFDQSIRMRLYYKGYQLYESYWNDSTTSVTVNYSNGTRMKEGQYALGDSEMSCPGRTDPVTGGFETNCFFVQPPVKNGLWKYYRNGKLVKTEAYSRDKLLK